jgi:uncharacterized protein (DUF885 family)
MNKWIQFTIVLIISAFMSCNDQKKADVSNSADASFQTLSKDFIEGYLKWRPELAVSLGFHDYDGKISQLDKASLDIELTRLKNYDHKLEILDTALLSTKMFYDYRILKCGIRSEIFNFEDIQAYKKNPMIYVRIFDVNIYVKRNFASLDDRVKSIINIENHVSEIFSAAKNNLEDSLAQPYVQIAILIANGAADFLGNDLLVALKDVKNDSLMNLFRTANKKAIEEIRSFASYLEKEKLSKVHNHYAIGKEKYHKMLAEGELISLEPEKILEIGMAELKREEQIFNAAAKTINPNKKPVDVYHDIQKEHPVADSVIPEAKNRLEAIRQYIIDKKIVTIPSEVRVNVKETPQYARSTSTASMDVPGPFEKKATDAFYYITPVDKSWTAKQKEDWLAQFDYYTTDNISIHEVYPGHYNQFLHLNASSASDIEKIFSSYGYVEGWAHYTEKMMVDEGYGNTGDPIKAAKYRLSQSGDALLRLCRLCVSVKTHCEGISVDEATKFFMDHWHQGDKPSRQEAIRGTFDPSYCLYALGKLQILKLRDEYQKQEGQGFSLQKFHDMILDNGMPPIRLLREILLKDKNVWDEIL